MDLIEHISAEDMIAAWLQAEIDGGQRGSILKLLAMAYPGEPQEDLIRSPDLSNEEANFAREAIFSICRGWRRGVYMFPGFPVMDTVWHRATLRLEEVRAVLGSSGWEWDEFGGRSIGSAVEEVRSGREAPNLRDLGSLARAIAARYKIGAVLGPPILAALPSGGPLVALEGHKRLLGWALAERSEPLAVIVGLSARMAAWARF